VRFPYLEDFLVGKGVVPEEWYDARLEEIDTDEAAGAVTPRRPWAGGHDNAEPDHQAPEHPSSLIAEAAEFIAGMEAFLGAEEEETVRALTILPGTDKDGRPEATHELFIREGEVVCIVGPTGSGKSRLLADIEWLAQGDTPTGRRVLVNGKEPDISRRFGGGPGIVAQLSQNMNFVMDVSVSEFLALHAESRLVPDAQGVCRRVIDCANELAGEPFSGDTQLTALSGGQSRALMIADTAILSSSPVVLIDEIENAGIDRLSALELLTGERKIVLMATHDPMLTLKADRRLVIENGGIRAVLEPTEAEQMLLTELARIDARQSALRTALRRGERVGPADGAAPETRGVPETQGASATPGHATIESQTLNSTGGTQ
jgi:ABC-type lipoprotein export system ATPase subunit